MYKSTSLHKAQNLDTLKLGSWTDTILNYMDL